LPESRHDPFGDGIGLILDKFVFLSVRDNMIAVSTSDHGDMMGEHRPFFIGFMYYRGTLQEPMVIDVPGKPWEMR
jgi:arylsulfatase A-like enzyme